MADIDQQSLQYLLTELSPSERDAFEREYFSVPEVFDRLERSEWELLDAYGRNELPPEQRGRVERVYLADVRRMFRLRLARSIVILADADGARASIRVTRTGSHVWTFAAVAAAASLAIGSATLGLQVRRLRQALDAAMSARAEMEASLRAQVARNHDVGTPPQAGIAPFIALTLIAPTVRGVDASPAPTLVIPAGTREVRIDLTADAPDYPSYLLILQRIGGPEITAIDPSPPRTSGSRLTFAMMVPADRMSTGDYMLTLHGVAGNGDVDAVSRSLFHAQQR